MTPYDRGMNSPNPNWKPGDKITAPVGEMVTLDPEKMSTNDVYKLMIGTIVPRPIAFVSTMNGKGGVNLAPFSFFTGVSSNPPCLAISIARKPDGEKKDTLKNIEETEEFVVNTASEWLVEPLVHCAGEFSYGVDEMATVGLTPLPSTKIKPPRVKESPVHFECKSVGTLEIGEGKAGSATLVVGHIVAVHVDGGVYKDGKVHSPSLKPVARLGGPTYALLGQMFDIPVPKV